MRTTTEGRSIRNVLITRSKEGNEELASKIASAGFNPIPIETIVLSPPRDWSSVDGLLHSLRSFDWLVFTSVNGVEYFVRRAVALSIVLPWEGKPFVAAVGKGTARSLASAGVATNFIPSAYLTKTLAEELPADRGSRVLLLRGDIVDPGLSETLRGRGCQVHEATVYVTKPGNRPADRRLRDIDLIVFASASAVRGFLGVVPKDKAATLLVTRTVCIGPVTATAAKENGFTNTFIPRSFTLDAVVEEIVRLSRVDA